ncbi:hypothetical protein [Nocardioides xinjiangensis]|uniref:hypothetical protein n=1 Tax=Nocardioides xinjiangensis TaxID=2817376 RepID=UPI001B317D6C|nr:hypothetical protein [Nocardioides sp. SYSU D00778]
MSKLVMMLLVVQVVVGSYLFMSVASSNSRSSTARATRLPSLVVFGHSLLGIIAPVWWVAWLLTADKMWVWVTLGSLLASVAGGLVMAARTFGHSDTLHKPAADPADVRVVEKQIPKSVLLGHGLGATALVGLVLVVGLTS